MRVNKKKKQKTKVKPEPKNPNIRNLTIQHRYRRANQELHKVPEIRFSGIWLMELGFNIQDKVTIHTAEKRLVIELDDKIEM